MPKNDIITERTRALCLSMSSTQQSLTPIAGSINCVCSGNGRSISTSIHGGQLDYSLTPLHLGTVYSMNLHLVSGQGVKRHGGFSGWGASVVGWGRRDNNILFNYKSEWFSIFVGTYRMMFALILTESVGHTVPGKAQAEKEEEGCVERTRDK